MTRPVRSSTASFRGTSTTGTPPSPEADDRDTDLGFQAALLADQSRGPDGASSVLGHRRVGDPFAAGFSLPSLCVPVAGDLLDFERTAPRHPSMKARACRRRFGFSLSLYYLYLYRALDRNPELRADPVAQELLVQRALHRHRRVLGHLVVSEPGTVGEAEGRC